MSPLVAIVGETASGKSTLALDLAQRINGEIICADAWTVRQQADIGTAKPSKDDQKLVPHHLLDIIGPNDKFTAADFKVLASRSINEINAKNKLPIIVGGTGLYIDGLIYDYSFLQTHTDHKRESLNKLSLEELIHLAKAKNLVLDNIDLKNKRRVIRMIETGGQISTHADLRENTIVLGIKQNKDELKNRIERRVDSMLNAGLEDEVRQLSQRYGWSCEALKAIGYKEWQPYLDGQINYEELRARIIKNTVDLAKRQRTWFKRNKSIHWLETPVNLDDVVELITTYFET